MAQKASLMGSSGGSGSSKKKKTYTPNSSGSIFKPINNVPKLTVPQMADNIASYNPKPMNTGQGPTREKSTKQTTAPKPTNTTVNVSGGGGGGVSTPKVTDTAKTMEQRQKEKEKEFQSKYEKQIQNELDLHEKQLRDELDRLETSTNNDISRYDASLQDQIARMQQQGQNAIGRNNEYLSQQIGQLQDQRLVADQDTINLMNRRGAFYSGGTDYYLAQNQRATQEATGNLQSEIGSRNAEIEEGNMMAIQQANRQFSDYREKALEGITMTREQAMGTMNMMREQAPDRVRQLVDEALERQWAKDFQMEQFNWQKQQAAAAAAFRQQQAAASAARAAASQSIANQRYADQQKQQAWENQMAEKQFNLQAAGSQPSSSSGLGQRDLEVFQSQYTGSSPQDARSFVNQQYANGMLYDEGEADQLESYLNSLRSPGGSNSNNRASFSPASPRNIGSQYIPSGW